MSIPFAIIRILMVVTVSVMAANEEATATEASFISRCPNKNCAPNEYFTECGSPCQTECATLNEPCMIVNKVCPCGCYCNEGFARNSLGKCIPIEQCPKKRNCRCHRSPCKL